jgi:replicative DNA helicase
MPDSESQTALPTQISLPKIQISPELLVLRYFCHNREHLQRYQEIYDSVSIEPTITMLYKAIKEYYQQYREHIYIHEDELQASILMTYGSYKDFKILQQLLADIFSINVSDSVCKSTINNIVERNIANRIVNNLLPIIAENKTGSGILTAVAEDLTEYARYTEQQSAISIFEETPLLSLLETYAPPVGSGLTWKLRSIQEVLGPIVPGTFIHLASRPEYGKTSFLADQMVHVAQQLKEGQCILWCNNEEAGGRIRLRLFNALMGMDKYNLQAAYEEAEAVYKHNIGNKIKLILDKHAASSIEQIRAYCKEYQPTILIVDHADKPTFSGSKQMELPVRLRELFNKYRAIGKEFGCTVIAVGHTSTEAEGKKWIDNNSLDYSKTGKAAEVDVIMGIGMTNVEAEAGYRYLSFPKSKLTGLHSKVTLRFNSKTSTYTDI